MKHKEPEELNSETPQWFKDWRNKEFWHFKINVETKLSLYTKLLWAILVAIIGLAIVRALG